MVDFPEISSATTKAPMAPVAEPVQNDWPTAEPPRVSPPIRTTGQIQAIPAADPFGPDHNASGHRAPGHNTTSGPLGGAVATLARPDAAVIVENGPVDVEDLLPAAELSPRFRFDPVAERDDRRTSRFSRLVQGAMLVGVVGAVGAFILMLPDDGSGAENADASRVETVDSPVAVAEMPTSADTPQIEGSLGDTGGFGDLNTFATPTPGSPADSDDFDIAVAGALDDASEIAEQDTTTTTVWVEPTLPPESEWVDSGNGVMVPDLQLRIRFCESTNNYLAANGYSTARGAYQFLIGSWDWYGHAAVTGVTEAHLATPAQQDEAALRTLQKEGTGPWAESRKCWADPNIDPRYATAAPPQPTTTTTVAEDDSTTTTADPNESTTTTATSETTVTTTTDTTAPPTSSTDTTEAPTTTTTAETTTTTTAESTTTSSG